MTNATTTPPSSLPVSLRGKAYTLRAPSLDDIAAIEDRIREDMPSPLARAKRNVNDLPLELPKHVLTAAFELECNGPQHVTAQQFEAFLNSRAGTGFTFYLMVRRDQPEVTREEVAALVESLTADELRQICEWRDSLAEAERAANAKDGDAT